MIWFVCEDLYLPISIKEVSHAFDTCSSNLIDSLMKGERSFNIHYNNTIEYFNNNCSITMPITSVDFHLQTRDLLKINCLDGYVKLNYYIGEYLE